MGQNTGDSNWSGTVLVWDEQAIFLGSAADASLHESPAIKVCVALDGNFGLRASEDEQWSDYDSAIIAAGQPHAIDGRHHKMAMLLLVPEASLAQLLRPIYQKNGITRIPVDIVSKLRRIFANLQELLTSEYPLDTPLDDFCFQVVNTIANGEALPIDKRIAQSIEEIRSRRDEGISFEEIAASVELSESRLSHLFTKNVQISIRRYLLWLRLRDAMHLLVSSASLTQIAHEAGFSDSAHLTRTFRGMLGITPSALVKDSTIYSILD